MSSRLLLALKSWPRMGKWSLPRNAGGNYHQPCLFARVARGCSADGGGGARREAGAWEVRGLKGGTEGQGPSLGLGP